MIHFLKTVIEMNSIKQRTSETAFLIGIVAIAIVLSFIMLFAGINTFMHSFFLKNSAGYIADFVVNFVFLCLAGFLWLSYRKWLHTESTRRDFERIIEGISQDVILVVGTDRTITWCNSAVRIMFGYEPGELLNRKTDLLYFDRRIDPDRHGEITEMLDAQGFHRGMAQGKRKEGGLLHLEIITSRMSNGNGAALLIRDITKRIEAEEARRKIERKVSQILEGLSEAVLLIGRDGTTPYENSLVRSILGKGGDLLAGVSPEMIPTVMQVYISGTDQIYPHDRFPLTRALNGEKSTIDNADIHLPESIVPVEISASPLCDGVGVVTHAVMTFRDINERKQMEQAIISARNFYLSLMDDLVIPIWRSGIDGKCNYVNYAWLAFTGRKLADELGYGWADGIHHDDRQRVIDAYLRAFKTRRPFKATFRLKYSDGGYRWVTQYARKFNDPEGDFAGFIGACVDVCERVSE